MKKILFLLLLTLHPLMAQEINVAVAANVSYAIDELKAVFVSKYPQTKVRVTLGSSGKLTAQIKNGAPYGLFMSANMDFPEALYKDKIAITKPVVYAEGALAYLSVKKQDFGRGISLLNSQSIQKIAIANPKTAPYGKAALEAMQKAGIYESIKDKLVYAESISQTVAYSVTAADIGLIAKSSLYSQNMRHYKEDTHYKDVDPKLYTPIRQGIVLLEYSKHDPLYKAFYDFILGDEAKDIFKKYGYITQ
ncbi:molybdate ABC transporter substrate-binding protein [bacterium]|nr:molybdate ABC transporter substrate-binding protein [bacterium]